MGKTIVERGNLKMKSEVLSVSEANFCTAHVPDSENTKLTEPNRLENLAIRAWKKFKTVQEISPLTLREMVRGRGQCNCANHLNNSTFHSSLFKLKGFTLAEVLITLGVIGVIAAITMPMLVANINERVNSERHANIAYKVTQAMEQMRAHGKLVQYASTDDFADELQKYLKITKRCDKEHLADCWTSDKVIGSDGEEYTVSNTKTGNKLGLYYGDTDNVGLILADGSPIILNYNPKEEGFDIGDSVTASNKELPVGNGKYKEFAYTTNVTASIDFVTDVNGKRGPNSETVDGKYNDIRAFKGARFGQSCIGHTDNGKCVIDIGSSYRGADCSSSSSPDYKYCGSNPSGNSQDHVAGARKACDALGMELPDESVLRALYGKPGMPTVNYYWTSTEHTIYPTDLGVRVNMSDGVGYHGEKAETYFSPVMCVSK